MKLRAWSIQTFPSLTFHFSYKIRHGDDIWVMLDRSELKPLKLLTPSSQIVSRWQILDRIIGSCNFHIIVCAGIHEMGGVMGAKMKNGEITLGPTNK